MAFAPKQAQPGSPRLGNYECPECGYRMAPRRIHEHTSQCKPWLAKHVEPYPYFKAGSPAYSFGPDAVEGTDYVQCKICLEFGWDFSFKRMIQHINDVHLLTEEAYLARFPRSEIRLSKTTEKRKNTTLERYGVDNVTHLESSKKKTKETLIAHYGSDNTNLIPEIQAKRVQSNLERYGAENPFGSPEIQEKIRETMIEKYGVANAQQIPEIRARTMETNLERYGAKHYFVTDGFREEFKEVCQERYGEDHHLQSEKWREDTGYVSPLSNPEVQRKAYNTNLANHGGTHSQTHPEILAKARATWMEKYGVDNPSKCEAVLLKIKEVWMGKYGVPFPPQSLWSNQNNSFPNKLEQRVDKLSPECVIYTGDGSYWVRHKGAMRARNPDFVILKREQLKFYQDGAKINDLRTSAVLEIFGDYWHGPAKTGKSRILHKIEVERYYALCGISCLVLWESEVNSDPALAARRIKSFLQEWRSGQREDKDAGMTVFDFFSQA